MDAAGSCYVVSGFTLKHLELVFFKPGNRPNLQMTLECLMQRTFGLKVTVGEVVVVAVLFAADRSGNLKINVVSKPLYNLSLCSVDGRGFEEEGII